MSEKIKAIIFDLDDTLLHNNVPLTKVRPLLRKLNKEYKLILLTNGKKEDTEKKLTFANLKFDYVFSRKNFFNRKPGKPIYKEILKLLDLESKEVLAVGDKLVTDILGANRMKIVSVWFISPKKFILNKLTKLLIRPKFVIRDILELESVLELLNRN
jgi:HAD superfamily hydrolase (TIGR01662 family)